MTALDHHGVHASPTGAAARPVARAHLRCLFRCLLPCLLLVSLALGTVGCGGESGEHQAQAESDPAKLPDTPAEAPELVAAAHILIGYQGALRAPESVTRSKEEAQALAAELRDRARAANSDFGALAREYSDGPTADRGGYLGIIRRGMVVESFENAVFGMREGQVSDVVETPFGFHVIQRRTIDPEMLEQVTASHILIQYEGAARAEGITRTREEALALAEEVARKAGAEGADFAALAREYSDGPSAEAGGQLGTFGHGAMVPAFEEAAFALEPGEVSGVVETPFGYHVILRQE